MNKSWDTDGERMTRGYCAAKLADVRDAMHAVRCNIRESNTYRMVRPALLEAARKYRAALRDNAWD
jgi:hypothetical protein